MKTFDIENKLEDKFLNINNKTEDEFSAWKIRLKTEFIKINDKKTTYYFFLTLKFNWMLFWRQILINIKRKLFLNISSFTYSSDDENLILIIKNEDEIKQ